MHALDLKSQLTLETKTCRSFGRFAQILWPTVVGTPPPLGPGGRRQPGQPGQPQGPAQGLWPTTKLPFMECFEEWLVRKGRALAGFFGALLALPKVCLGPALPAATQQQ